MAATQSDNIIKDILHIFNPIKYLAYVSLLPTIIYTFTTVVSLIYRFVSRPILHVK